MVSARISQKAFILKAWWEKRQGREQMGDERKDLDLILRRGYIHLVAQ